MARALSALVLAVSLVGCGGSSFTEAGDTDAGAGTGNNGGGDASAGRGGSSAGSGGAGQGGAAGTGGFGGAAGAGGASGVGGAGGSQDHICAPMPGCSSNTSCSDGCNTCSCFNGMWACTERACPVDAAPPPDAATGSCEQDSDCVYRSQAGCCGMCLATTDPVPPTILCGAVCLSTQPSCVCIDHHCGTGTLGSGASCDPSHDLCGASLKCCAQCGGIALPDGAPPQCSTPICVQSAGGTCPPSA